MAGATLTNADQHIRSSGVAAQQAVPGATRNVTGEEAARVHCTPCHLLPPADVLPRSVWRDEIARMFLIRSNQPEPSGPPGTAARMVKLPVDWQSVLDYYEAAAPQQLPPPTDWPAPDRTVPFERRVISAPPGLSNPAVANIRLVDADQDGRLEIIVSDMRSGIIYKANPRAGQPAFVEIARLSNPAHVAPVDLDGDGVLDFLVADLGRFAPSDHDRGAVHWLRGRRDGTYLTTTLKRGPRVSDVEAADFDGDGRLDLAVAAFGWRRTGDFTILKNETVDQARPSFVPYPVDRRTGAIHGIPADVNGDGKPDVIALFAQEHETVVAFLNRGRMQFDSQVVYAAPHPAWGSSGIQVLDLDKDGDADVLMTNGDTFDDMLPKPYHGIQWLENRGTFPFTEHTLATMAGVLRAQAVDLDADGDLDIVASALLAAADAQARSRPAVVWLEQTRPGVFERHSLKVGLSTHATLDTGDLDNDGDIDVVVGNFSLDAPLPDSIEVFENLRVRQ